MIVKVAFICMIIYSYYLVIVWPKDTVAYAKADRRRRLLESMFFVLVGLLLMYLFNPRARHETLLDPMAKVVITFFAIVVVIDYGKQFILQ